MIESIGQVLKSYVLRERVGGDSIVSYYHAYRLVDQQEVLIRVVTPQIANRPDFIRDFEKEAQIVARLEHPHIVPLVDFWRDPGGAYLITPQLGAVSLSPPTTQPWDLDAAACFVQQIGGALAYAHRKGIIHGDIRPQNILIDAEDNCHLTGFAVARMLRRDSQTLFAWKGTDYISPEEFWGKPVSQQSDIYSLAILLYELLTGDMLGNRHIYGSLPDVRDKRPDAAPSLNKVIQKATNHEIDENYSDVLDMVTDLQRALLGEALYPIVVPIYNPYPGPRPFLETDASNFFGRETLTRRLLTRLTEENDAPHFLAVVGPSGSGKSSVVRAGLIPALRQGAFHGSDQLFVAVMVPSSHPFDELEVVLNKLAGQPTTNIMEQLTRDERGLLRAVRMILPESGHLVLVIDQFEGLFVQVSDQAIIQQFLELILVAATYTPSPLHIIITLRADFTDRPLLHPHFGNLMRQCTEFITPMASDELRQAIIRPAERVGVQIERGLIEAIISEVGEQPGTLPMMQYALAELFDQRQDGNILTLDAYNRIGGTLGAMTRRADDIYAHLSDPAKAMTEQLFLRLVTLGEGVEDTRRRAFQRELLDIGGDVMASLLDTFVHSRLLMVDRDPATHEETVELSHEAILRKWQQLRVWLEANRADVRMQRQLFSAALEWRSAHKDPSFLLRGAQLRQFEDWNRQTRVRLAADEQDYLAASSAAYAQQTAEDLARQRREQVLQNQVRRFLVVITVVLLMAVAIGTNLALRIQHEANRAQALALVANAQLALSVSNPDLAIVLAVEANNIDEAPPDARRILMEITTAARTRRLFAGHTANVRSVALSPDGQRAISGSDDDSLILWDVGSSQPLARFQEHTGNVMDVVFSPGGEFALSGSNDGELILWDVDPDSTTFGQAILRFRGHTQAVLTAAFSSDGRSVISGGCGRAEGPTCTVGELILWDIETGQAIRRLYGHTDRVWSVDFSPDGKFIISGSDDNNLILWNVAVDDDLNTEANEQIIRRLTGHTDSVRSVVFSPDGRRVLSGSYDNSLILWNMAQDSPAFGQIIRRFEGHTDNVRDVAFSPDGQEILSGSDDRTLIQWQMFTGQRIRTYRGHFQGVTSVVFSPDGQEALSGSIDGTLRLWALDDAGSSGESVIEWVCENRYVRNLTPEEQEAYTVSDTTCS